jgi:hypothetical protein
MKSGQGPAKVCRAITRWSGFTVGYICICNKRTSRPVKGKVGPVLNSLSTTPWRRMGSGCIDLHFLDLCTSWRWVVSFTPRPLYSRRKGPWYPWDRRLGGPLIRFGRHGEEKILDPTGTRTPTPRSSARSWSLYRLSYPGSPPYQWDM